MSRSCPHPLALFSLKPLNDRADGVVAHPSNSHLVSTLPDDGTLVLDIGFNIRSESCNTLATLGRKNTVDIFVEGSSIGRVQCSFEINQDTGVIMLYDRSHSQSTQVYGENATPFEHGRVRQVVVQKELNTIIGMGGEGRDLVQFELLWHQDPVQTTEKVKNKENRPCHQEEHPRLARTIDEEPTALPSQRLTRIHTPGERPLKMRYAKIGPPLGSGIFGTVYKSVDVDTGRFMAVKILQRPTGRTEKERGEKELEFYRLVKREVETIAEISHVSRHLLHHFIRIN
jgi:hypothetical protein